MDSFTLLVLSSAIVTASILLHSSSLSHASKSLAWTQACSIYKGHVLPNIVAIWWKRFNYVTVVAPPYRTSSNDVRESKIKAIQALADHHEVAEILSDMIRKDGAGSWPPNANHVHRTWPSPLQPYKDIYLELAPLLPQAAPSLNDAVNIARIDEFRRRFRKSLRERVDLVMVKKVSKAEGTTRTKKLANKIISFFRQPMRDVGLISLVTHTMPSTAVSPGADTHTDGPLFPSSRLPN
jgi:hypothetical protein